MPATSFEEVCSSRTRRSGCATHKVKERKGRLVKGRTLRRDIEGALAVPGGDRTLPIRAVSIRPKVTTSQLAANYPTVITIDNKAHPTYTLIQIQTADRIGLLYDLLKCFGRNGVAMALSRISTESGAAMDTFYVTDNVARSKITDSHRIKQLQTELQRAVLAGA